MKCHTVICKVSLPLLSKTFGVHYMWGFICGLELVKSLGQSTLIMPFNIHPFFLMPHSQRRHMRCEEQLCQPSSPWDGLYLRSLHCSPSHGTDWEILRGFRTTLTFERSISARMTLRWVYYFLPMGHWTIIALFYSADVPPIFHLSFLIVNRWPTLDLANHLRYL